MYIFLVGLVALMLFGMYQVLESRTVCVSILSTLVFLMFGLYVVGLHLGDGSSSSLCCNVIMKCLR